ncbi:MAG TPA: hypothetical protein VMW42_06470 [Desulfatiglandales bacterium]|nr:hypothetical protein [Desulfatiglandales bacterium]
MQAKKYRAHTIKESIAKVKNALGQDAMIISTRKVNGGCENDLFEITAVPSGNGISGKDLNPLSEVKSELISIKEMVYIMNHYGSTIERLVLNPFILNLYAKLIRNGVNDHYARVFLERAGALQEHRIDNKDNINIGEEIIREIMHAIKVKDPFYKKTKNQILAAFIGTTGVGKTTTVAKLAARLMLKGRRKVGLISIDSYRIGAMEQLKTYADILGVLYFPVFQRKDLLSAIKRMKDTDVVLIDTAGQSQYDRSKIEELKKIMTEDLGINSHLLLSVSTSESEMNKIAVNFSPLNFQSYIFTKVDEAERCGSVINQMMRLQMPISYITTGQNVPDDIEFADKRNILRLLLNKN